MVAGMTDPIVPSDLTSPLVAEVARTWKCTCCQTNFVASEREWGRLSASQRCAPNCPHCKAWNQYTYPVGIGGLIDELEHYGFSCDAGPLAKCDEWRRLLEKIANLPPEGNPTPPSEAWFSAEAVLDAAHVYALQQYGHGYLDNPIDRERIIHALSPPLPATTGERASDDLVQRCKEIIERNETGVLKANGALRAFAKTLPHPSDPSIILRAERETADEAMRVIVGLSPVAPAPGKWQPSEGLKDHEY